MDKREPTKCDRLLWVDPDRLPPNVVPYVHRALAHDRAGVWFDSYGWDDDLATWAAGDDSAVG